MAAATTLSALAHIQCRTTRLYLSPVEKGKVHKILDIGTGTGIWAVEMGDIFPDAQESDCIQLRLIPPNVKFEVDDVESEWLSDRKYDFILCRYMLASIGDWPKLVKNIYDNLAPGGWAEFQDMSAEWYSDDGTLTEKHEMFHQKYKVPISPWAKEQRLKEIGLLNLAQVPGGLEAFTIRAFCGFLGKSTEEVLETISEVRKELKALHLFHAQFDM
ncbi:UMTA methyltransferase [Colletotrichum sojae]|uniref:UMTA methyltransferase n=1 Tax=Colletotrichum sojae TaxID=2175907 RepID=A0A8H6IUE0_9PEZI|nr:UMTA methyltransferase [Colletotrichum sojae]